MPLDSPPRDALALPAVALGRGARQRKHDVVRAKHGNAWHSPHDQSPGLPPVPPSPPAPPSRRPARASRPSRPLRLPPLPPPPLPPFERPEESSRRPPVAPSSRLARRMTSLSRSSKRACSPRCAPPFLCMVPPSLGTGWRCAEWWPCRRPRASATRASTRASPLARLCRLCQAGSPRGLVARQGCAAPHGGGAST